MRVGRLGPGGGCGVDAQSVDLGVHKIADSLINESVAAYQAQALELFRDDLDVEMSSAGFRASMADMFVAFVSYHEFDRIQSRAQSGSDIFYSLFVHGKTSLNGLTIMLW